MNREQFENLLKPLIEIIDDIELDLIKDILSRIDNYDGVKGSLEWYAKKLTETGLLKKDNLKVFKSNKNKLKKVIQDIANECAKIDNIEKYQEYYDKGLLDTNPSNLFDSIALNNLIKEAVSDTDDIMDLIQTKAIQGSNRAYKNILNKAYVATASNTYVYSQAIMNASQELIDNGIQVVNYESGKNYSIEAVTRRDVVTRMNKLVGDKEIEVAKELGTNLIRVSQHLGARTRTKYTKHDYEAHDEWQGKVYMIEGSSDKYPNLAEKTGYGEMLGLKGINCYHNMYTYFEWEEIPEQIDIEESRKVRKLLDTRRAYERKIRKLKREKEVAKTLDDKEAFTKVNQKLKSVNKDFNSFLDKNDMVHDYSREWIAKKE